jgi:hypothetical protein
LLCLIMLSAFYFSFAWLSDAAAEQAVTSAEDSEDGSTEEEGGQVIAIAGAGGRPRVLRQDHSR